jgi:hypothetical protein
MEAGKNFVDIVFSFLMLPRLEQNFFNLFLKVWSLNEWPVGTIFNIFKSVVKLIDSYMNIGCKDILLSPQPASGYRESSLLRIEGVVSEPKTYYTCSNYDCPDDETVIKRTHSQTFVQDAGFR